MQSRDILRKAKGIILIRVHSDQMVLKMIRQGRLVLFYWRPRVSTLTQRRLSYTQTLHCCNILVHFIIGSCPDQLAPNTTVRNLLYPILS
jgi:hypothetical protein